MMVPPKKVNQRPFYFPRVILLCYFSFSSDFAKAVSPFQTKHDVWCFQLPAPEFSMWLTFKDQTMQTPERLLHTFIHVYFFSLFSPDSEKDTVASNWQDNKVSDWSAWMWSAVLSVRSILCSLGANLLLFCSINIIKASEASGNCASLRRDDVWESSRRRLLAGPTWTETRFFFTRPESH